MGGTVNGAACFYNLTVLFCGRDEKSPLLTARGIFVDTYKFFFISSTMKLFGCTPTMWETIFPFLKSIRVGMLTTSYWRVIFGFSSTFILPTFIFPSNSVAISATTGERTLQGPHQTAHKSTRTGILDWSTSWSKFCSVRVISIYLFPK
jgi:hypothetical protein